jgi:hypothetical protein
MPHRRSFRLPVAALIAAAAVVSTSASAAADSAPDPFADESLQTTTTFGGASPLATTRTVAHWSGETTNPVDHITYHYNMVGVDPGTDGSATIGVDIIPLDVTVAGQTFSGSDAVAAVVASPLFQNGDYSTTAHVTRALGGKGSGGNLSAGNDGVQLLDATMRAQFNKVGTGYHLILEPTVLDAVAIDVSDDNGTTLTSPMPRNITYADLSDHWFATRIQNQLGKLHLDPTRLALFLTKDVVLFGGGNPMNCCVIGAHGAGPATGQTNGSAHGNGNQPVQTYAWASWMTAGFFSPRTSWAKQDIHGLSHELAEWASNPFVDNTVESWSSPKAPQYGCSNQLETGDPVLGIGFTQGTTSFDQNAYTDGAYHPEDEVFLPWFMRTAPNDISQPRQGDSSAGRYTFLGDLNPFGFFSEPPPSC